MMVDGLTEFGDCAGIVADDIDDGGRRSRETCEGKVESEALPTIQSLPSRSETSRTTFRVYTYRGVPCNDLTIGQSQETFVNPCLVQLWQTHEVACCRQCSCSNLGRNVN